MRLVALGASNLTRGLAAVVAAAREAWGPDLEVLAALGHGRSYGAESRVLVRTLPSILDCGLWAELDRRPRVATRALVTDIGNDIPHGRPAGRILAWVEECIERLHAAGADGIVMTDLPMAGLRRLPPFVYRLFRSLYFPGSRLPLPRAAAEAEAVSAGLAMVARRKGVTLVQARPEWYGFDPIHIRRRTQPAAWSEILGRPAAATGRLRVRLAEAVECYRLQLRPERQSWLGMLQVTPQKGRRLRRGGRIDLY